jgi:hypothetical protein
MVFTVVEFTAKRSNPEKSSTRIWQRAIKKLRNTLREFWSFLLVLVVRDLSVIHRNLIPSPVKALISALTFQGVGRYQLVPGIASCDIFIEPRWIVIVKIDDQSIRKTGIAVDILSNNVWKTK